MPTRTEFAYWTYTDEHGVPHKTAERLDAVTARERLPANATRVDSSVEIRDVSSNDRERSNAHITPSQSWGKMTSSRPDTRPAQKLIVCGAFNYNNKALVFAALDKVSERRRLGTLIHRQEPGVDLLVVDWARANVAISLIAVPLLTKRHREKAREQQAWDLFSHKPNGVIAFPGDLWTCEILAIAGEMNLPVWMPYGP